MLKKIFYILIISTTLSGCRSDVTELPDIFVDEMVYLGSYPYNKLFPGSWAPVNGGLKGIILYRVSETEFKAYDRACPHIPLNDCSVLKAVEGSSVKVVCECDDKEFLVVTGEPLNGAPVGLKVYRTYYDANSQTVHISN